MKGAEPALSGITPMVSWNLTIAGNVLTNGSQDNYITKMANEAQAFGKPVFIRLDWEIYGGWYNNYDQKGGTTPALCVASWQHVRDSWKSIAPNAAFVWCPNVGEFSNPSGAKVPDAVNVWTSTPGVLACIDELSGPDVFLPS